jgi:AcrR family transcriptional regulator
MTVALKGGVSTAEQIRTMACDLFCRDGYKGVGMRSLAAAVGIHAGSLYNHIDSKQALLNELISDYEQNLLQVFRNKRLARVDSAAQMVAMLWEQVERYVTDNSKLAQLARAQHCHLTEAQAQSIALLRKRQVRELRLLLSRLPDTGLGSQGLLEVAEELYTLLDCNANLIVDANAPANSFVRRQLRDMASMLMIKRD